MPEPWQKFVPVAIHPAVHNTMSISGIAEGGGGGGFGAQAPPCQLLYIQTCLIL